MDKEHIVAEIKRTAEENGGVPLEIERFLQKGEKWCQFCKLFSVTWRPFNFLGYCQ